ncbi:hypothetical protein GGS20DRAFT_324876 [Poronia punctata]|nr:hypothetical protein GGS20DRAFT_324876 [Poronia punctata]
MTILEIALPNLKKDTAVVKQAVEEVIPVLKPLFIQHGVLANLRGFIETEDGKDVRDQFREILLLEWPTTEHFQSLIQSSGFHGAMDIVKKYANGPPHLKLFEVTESLAAIFPEKAVAEYLMIKPKDEASKDRILEKLRPGLASLGTARATVGPSANLDPVEIAVLGLYEDQAELDAAKKSSERQSLLADISVEATVTSLVAPVSRD